MPDGIKTRVIEEIHYSLFTIHYSLFTIHYLPPHPNPPRTGEGANINTLSPASLSSLQNREPLFGGATHVNSSRRALNLFHIPLLTLSPASLPSLQNREPLFGALDHFRLYVSLNRGFLMWDVFFALLFPFCCFIFVCRLLVYVRSLYLFSGL